MTYPKKQAEAQMIFRKTGGFVQGNMTLRDHFAGLAMMGLMGRVWGDLPADELFIVWSKSAYAMADAMLKAREA